MSNPTRHPPQFFISLYGWTFWTPILATGVFTVLVFSLLHLWWLVAVFAVLTVACLAFYRDFDRPIPTGEGLMVAPADGKVTEIATLDFYKPFDGPALKVSIFLSVLDVHVNRSPCDGVVLWTRYEEGLFLDARHPDCSSKNQSNTICIGEEKPGARSQKPEDGRPIAVVKQIVGAIARRIIAPVTVGERFTRGQRFGMIAFGSRTELYVPAREGWKAAVELGTHVKGGKDVLLRRS